MRTLVVGDIHGCSNAFETLLRTVAPQPGDTLVTLGDYVDRGPNSCAVIERLIALQEEVNLVSLRGNHEIMMLEARDEPGMEKSWRACDGEQTLRSYGGGLDKVPVRHWKFIENECRNLWENPTHFFVHANVDPDMELCDQPDYRLLWERFYYPAPHCSGKVMVCGHTSQKSGLPLNLGHAVCLDTWAYGRGWLSCWHIESGRVWQSRQNGEERELRMDDWLQD